MRAFRNICLLLLCVLIAACTVVWKSTDVSVISTTDVGLVVAEDSDTNSHNSPEPKKDDSK